MRITVSDVDRMTPPAEVVDLVQRADKEGHALQGGGRSTQGTARLFGIRVDGPGWDVVMMWSAPQESAPYLSSLLMREGDGEWSVVSVTQARNCISGRS